MALVGLVPWWLLLGSACLVLVALLSPTLLPRSGLLEVQLNTNRTLSLGPMGQLSLLSPIFRQTFSRAHLHFAGSCLRTTSAGTALVTKCTSATFTPVFLPTYTSLSISNSVAATLPFSLPLFPSSLPLTLLLQSLAITLYAFHSFPSTPSPPTQLSPIAGPWGSTASSSSSSPSASGSWRRFRNGSCWTARLVCGEREARSL